MNYGVLDWLDAVLFSLSVSFGILGFLLRWVFFLLESLLGKVLILDHLKKRGSLANMCFLCKEKEESIDHYLFIAQSLECCKIFS